MGGIQPDESGLASALLNVGRQLGGSIGIAVMGTIASTMARDQLARAVPGHAAFNMALTSGFGAAFAVGGFIALAGFVTALVAVQGRSLVAPLELETEMAA